MKDITEFIKELLNEYYPSLGECFAVDPVKEGDTNNSFMARFRNAEGLQDWYVRQYCEAEQERDIIYEHAFELYYNERVNGEIQTMAPVVNTMGKTWLRKEFDGIWNYYAVFSTIRGREPYSWEYNDLSENALNSCAEITAKFHAWAYGFVGPEGSGRRESPLEEQFEEWKVLLPKALEEKSQEPVFRRFTGYFKDVVPFLVDTADFCGRELAKYRDDLKVCINHKDLNPGNVMFDDNDEVCAIFDMDWVNSDYRLYDIAWMGYQAIASWDVEHYGEVPMDRINRFVDVYNRVMRERQCPLGELNASEVKFLPTMMIIGAMKVIVDFVYYEEHRHEVHRLLANTWRFVNSVKYMRDYVEGEMKNGN